ncbi:MAG: H-NS family nucleoid-associated regulatory protein [Boseongicola sp.]
MVKKDLNKLTLNELKALRKEVGAAISDFEARKRVEARKALEVVAKKHGMSLNEIIGRGKKGKKAKAPAKYSNPANSAETWSGRGRQPGWFKMAMSKGKKPESMEI